MRDAERPRLPAFAVLVWTVLAVVTAVTACGRAEGHADWRDSLHGASAVPSAPAPQADDAFPVPPPPFSPGVFPCTRCHSGGAVPDTDPAMPHRLHVGKGLECADCHAADGSGDDPRIPSRDVCDACHGDPAKLSPAAAAYFGRVTAADGSTAFPRRWRTRDVVPAHAKHAAAGVDCAACHGDPADGPFAKPAPVALMDRCVACHTSKGAPEACTACHTATTEKAHAGIVLRHAEEQRGCLDCHDEDDRDRLRLANGTPVAFDESYRLCGQCHGTQFRDWRVGLHGKRTGSWSGRREYRLCVHCHSPHAPRFPPMTPVARPARPEEVR